MHKGKNLVTSCLCGIPYLLLITQLHNFPFNFITVNMQQANRRRLVADQFTGAKESTAFVAARASDAAEKECWQ